MSQNQPEIIFAHTTAVAADPNRGVTPKIIGAKFTPRSALKKTLLSMKVLWLVYLHSPYIIYTIIRWTAKLCSNHFDELVFDFGKF